MDEMTMDDFQGAVTDWANRTFPGSTDNAKLAHLKKELDELCVAAVRGDLANMAEEAADMHLILLHFCGAHGISLNGEAKKKFVIVQARTWGEPDADGVVEHVR